MCNGILPIDQLREFTGPAGLVAQRIPKLFLEALYGIKINIRPFEEGGTGVPTAEELLIAYAVARGFTKTGQGQPDESRAARYILKDYVSGKLLFCQPPPNDPPIDPQNFNHDSYNTAHNIGVVHDAIGPRPGPLSETMDDSLMFDEPCPPLVRPVQGEKSARIDNNFFGPGHNSAGHLTMPFNYKYSEQGTASGKLLSGRKQREMAALEKGVDLREARTLNSKKHFKGKKSRGGVRAEE